MTARHSGVRNLFIFLSVALLVSGCQMSLIFGDYDKNGDANPSPIPSSKPGTSPSPGASPQPWDDLSTVDRVTILSLTPDGSFPANGFVELLFIPIDSTGTPILDTDIGVEVTALVDDAIQTNLSPDYPVVVPSTSNGLPYALTIDLDSSGSMEATDPNRLRVTAAKTFVDTLLNYRPSSRIRIADFGNGSNPPFSDSRLLSDFTSNRSNLYAAIDLVAAGGATPLYESVGELMDSMHSSKPESDFQRMMFVLSDGEPSSDVLRDSVYAKAQQYHMPIHAVFLGSRAGAATMAQLSAASSGLYAGAADSSDLVESFEAVVLGNEWGYMRLTASFAPSVRNLDHAVVTLRVFSGMGQKTATIRLDR
jgi:uncharacterized protein YegL